MKITGTIKLIETVGRTDTFVKHKEPFDYFLALKITDIDGQPISTVASVFAALKPILPSIKVNDEELIDLFEAYKLAPGMEDVCHLSLAYFGDFRFNRDTAQGLDKEKKLTAEEELDGQIISFDIDGCPFQVVSTSKDHNHLSTQADVAQAPFVGAGRDTIINLLPNQETQTKLSKTLACVFGEGFKIWNAQKKEIPFHVTIAQSDKINKKLAVVKASVTAPPEVSSLTP